MKRADNETYGDKIGKRRLWLAAVRICPERSCQKFLVDIKKEWVDTGEFKV